MKRYLFLVLLALSVVLKSQVPGYMGKRFIVSVGSSLALNFKPLYLLDNPNSTYLGPVFTKALNLEYVLSDRRVLCFSFRHLTRKIENEYYSPGSYYHTTNGFEKFTLLNYSIGVKRFSKRAIAPLGYYLKWECYYISGWMDYKSYLYPESTSYSYTWTEYDGGRIKFFGTGGAYSVGKQRIFKDKFVLDYGIRGTVMLVLFDSKSLNVYERQLASSATDVSFFSLINFNVNIGFLAF